ncbi:peptidase U32 family protein [Desulfovirgula thermocuniculi]|uniref:peptidase U32 family protein n=1 Tax=Desulfovirgula thermocuniculi TaxID=348842 RepID=UPI00040063A1|nr:peptidase U32 family protein [Desulfovirgula thermocuniculi]
MGQLEIELNTQVSTLEEVNARDLAPYQAVYLGNPYCPKHAGNLLENHRELAEAITRLKGMGKKAYVATPAAPRTGELGGVEKLVETAARAGADAVEAHNLGVVRLVHRRFPGLPVHTGCFANVYTDLGAAKLKEYGVRRVTPNYEVSLEEIHLIREAGGLEVEILLHGKMPLGLTNSCFLLNFPDHPCPQACREDFWLTTRDWVLKITGTVVWSGKDVCMLEHLPYLLESGYRAFRLETLYEPPEYRREVGLIYREALEHMAEGRELLWPAWLEMLKNWSRHGFCNGYYFGQAGRMYINQYGEPVSI